MTGAAFKRSRMHGGDPAKNETYGFTGWTQEGGYVSIHNGAKAPYKFTLDRQFGVRRGSGPFYASSAFAEDVAGLKEQYAYGETVQVPADGRVRILNLGQAPGLVAHA